MNLPRMRIEIRYIYIVRKTIPFSGSHFHVRVDYFLTTPFQTAVTPFRLKVFNQRH